MKLKKNTHPKEILESLTNCKFNVFTSLKELKKFINKHNNQTKIFILIEQNKSLPERVKHNL